MIRIDSYLNFQGNAEEAFQFYQSVFGGNFLQLTRFGDIPSFPGKAGLSEAELHKIMHVSLPIGDNRLMGTDMLEPLGHHLKHGNNITLSLDLDSRIQADWLYKALSDGGQAHAPMADTTWGYWGMLTDRFGIQWMVNVSK